MAETTKEQLRLNGTPEMKVLGPFVNSQKEHGQRRDTSLQVSFLLEAEVDALLAPACWQIICNAVLDSKESYTPAAKRALQYLSYQTYCRIRFPADQKGWSNQEGILQTPGGFPAEIQDSKPTKSWGLTKDVVCNGGCNGKRFRDCDRCGYYLPCQLLDLAVIRSAS